MYLNSMVIFVLFCLTFNHFLLTFHYGREYTMFYYHHFIIAPPRMPMQACVHIYTNTHSVSIHIYMYIKYIYTYLYHNLEFSS